MKKSIAIVLFLCMLMGMLSATAETAHAAEASAVTEAPVFTKKQVTAYDRDETKKLELTCMFRGDMPTVPFVDMEQYIDLVYQEDSDYTLTGDGDLYTITGNNRNTGKTGSALIVDTAKDTLTYEKYNEEDFITDTCCNYGFCNDFVSFGNADFCKNCRGEDYHT